MAIANGTSKPALNFEGGYVQIINGKVVPTEKTRHSLNPTNLEPKAEVPVATQEHIDQAVAAAKAAFKLGPRSPTRSGRRPCSRSRTRWMRCGGV